VKVYEAFSIHGIDTIERQHVEMDVQQQHSKIPIVPLLRFNIVFILTQGKNSGSSIIPSVAAIG